MLHALILILTIPLILVETVIRTLKSVMERHSAERRFDALVRDPSAQNATARGIDEFIEAILEEA